MALRSDADATLKTVRINLFGLHSLCSHHRTDMELAKLCGCFHCLKIYPVKEIKNWIDEPRQGCRGQTAVCPNCHVDSVLPDRVFGFRLTKKLLRTMRDYWFSAS